MYLYLRYLQINRVIGRAPLIAAFIYDIAVLATIVWILAS